MSNKCVIGRTKSITMKGDPGAKGAKMRLVNSLIIYCIYTCQQIKKKKKKKKNLDIFQASSKRSKQLNIVFYYC